MNSLELNIVMASSKKAMSSDNLAKQIMMCGQNKKYTELQELIAKCDVKLVCLKLSFNIQGNFAQLF